MGSSACRGVGGGRRVRGLVLPADEVDLEELLGSDVAGFIAGYDFTELQAVVERISTLAASVPNLAEIDLNPLIVSHDGVTAVEGTIRLRQWPVNPLAAVRTV